MEQGPARGLLRLGKPPRRQSPLEGVVPGKSHADCLTRGLVFHGKTLFVPVHGANDED
jgi:hypothetical protein